MAKQLKTHSGDTLSYDYRQKLFKSAVQNYDQSNRAHPPRDVRKMHIHDIISDLTETSKSLQKTYNIDSHTPFSMANMIKEEVEIINSM